MQGIFVIRLSDVEAHLPIFRIEKGILFFILFYFLQKKSVIEKKPKKNQNMEKSASLHRRHMKEWSNKVLTSPRLNNLLSRIFLYGSPAHITSDRTPTEQVISVPKINQKQLFYCNYIFYCIFKRLQHFIRYVASIKLFYTAHWSLIQVWHFYSSFLHDSLCFIV